MILCDPSMITWLHDYIRQSLSINPIAEDPAVCGLHPQGVHAIKNQWKTLENFSWKLEKSELIRVVRES